MAKSSILAFAAWFMDLHRDAPFAPVLTVEAGRCTVTFAFVEFDPNRGTEGWARQGGSSNGSFAR